MKSRVPWSVVAAMILLLPFLILSGCTYNRVQLAGGRTFAVERVESSPIYISWVYAEEQSEAMIIRGFLRTNSSHTHGTGHIDVAVIGPKGGLLEKTSVDYAPKDFSRVGRESWFEARFAFVPPDGSRIRVALHDSPNLEEGELDCGSNRAAKEGAAVDVQKGKAI